MVPVRIRLVFKDSTRSSKSLRALSASVSRAGVAVGSRLEAMSAKRRAYYFGTDRDGNNLLYEGICAEARVVSVIRAGIFVDLFGLEVWQRRACAASSPELRRRRMHPRAVLPPLCQTHFS